MDKILSQYQHQEYDSRFVVTALMDLFLEVYEIADYDSAYLNGILGWMYATGTGVQQDYERAVMYLQVAAKEGDAIAAFNLGILYLNGQGLRQDYKQAIKYFQIAAQKDILEAQYNIMIAEFSNVS